MLQTLESRLNALQRESLIQEGALRSAEQSLSSLEALVSSLKKEALVLASTEAALTTISNKVMSDSVTPIDDLVTRGIRHVFNDMNLEFKTKVEKSRGKTAVKFMLFQDGRECPILMSYGGGVVVVAGVLIRVVTIMTLKARRVLFLDETLAHVSKKYVPALSQLLRELCSALDFTIMMVTHTEEFAEYADTHYRAKPSANGTVFEKVATNKGVSV